MANQADQAIAFCEAQIGKPYVFGAAGPNSYDCSGLIMAAYAHASPPIRLTHFTGTMLGQGSPVSKAALQPGDLVFPDPGHVQLYVGNGQVIEAPHTGANVRKVAMWGFWQGRRVTSQPGTGSSDATTASVGGVASGVFGSLASVGKLVTTLLSVHFWIRFGYWIAGGLLLLIGAAILLKGSPAGNVGKSAVSTVKGLVT